MPRPPHWGGYRLMPDRIEFWQGRESRLHDRIQYRSDAGQWRIERRTVTREGEHHRKSFHALIGLGICNHVVLTGGASRWRFSPCRRAPRR